MTKQETQTEQPMSGQVDENVAEAENRIKSENNVKNQQEMNEKTAAESKTPEDKIAELETQLAETRDQLLRKAAEFENSRKRMNQEKINAIEYANQSLLLDIIPIIDDFERAINAGENGLQTKGSGSVDYAGFLEGIKMIEKRLVNQLDVKWGLRRFNSTGELFDPNIHEALLMEKSPDVSEGIVQEDLQKGYFLKERVLRAAQVKVLMPE